MFNIYKLYPRNVYPNLSMDINSQAPGGSPRTFTVNIMTRTPARVHAYTHTHTHSSPTINRQEAKKIKLLSHEQLKREKIPDLESNLR